MKPLYHFILEPKDGELYSNKLNGLVLSSSYENFRATQRVAKVIEVPIGYSGPIKKHDYVLTHHNVFRKSYDMKGVLSNGSDFLEPGKYLVDQDRIYMNSSDGETWSAIHPYVFVSPILNDNQFSHGAYKKEYGTVEYSSNDIVSTGDTVRFTPDSECEFMVNNKLMYRMKQTDLVWKVT